MRGIDSVQILTVTLFLVTYQVQHTDTRYRRRQVRTRYETVNKICTSCRVVYVDTRALVFSEPPSTTLNSSSDAHRSAAAGLD